ncbi:unnamed protein product [Gadus morhua 'NCC']
MEGELERIRSEFVKGVSEPVIKGLLDDLWQQNVFSSEEKDSVMEGQRIRADRARCLIDMVMGKGERASQAMIDSMKKRDKHLCSTLGLMSSLAGVGSAAVQCQHKIKSNLQKKFRETPICTDVTEVTSVDVLLDKPDQGQPAYLCLHLDNHTPCGSQ